MKNYLLGFLTFAILCICLKETKAQNFKNALSKSQVEQQLQIHLENNQSIMQWKSVDDDLLWNTLANEGDLVSIGYKPLSEANLKENMHLINPLDNEWNDAREKIINYIVKETQKKYGKSYTRDVLMQKSRNSVAPNFKIRVFDKDIIRQVRQMPEVRYFEPANTPDFNAVRFKSDSGCSSYTATLNSNDYTPISPNSRRSWHHDEHNVPCAWNNSNQGEGIWVAVMDTGLSSTQAKLNSEFAEGESGGRVVERYNSFESGGVVQTTNWQDPCGHGTAMAGLATAPRGFDSTPAGIAYRANLVSYRVTEDVIINRGDEQDGLAAALYHAADDSRINVISMSIGHVFSSGQVEDAIIYAHNRGKLMFAAAGTSLEITNFYPVIFPAWMPETVAVTGITDSSNRERCNVCHDGPEVDFVVEMQRASDDSRTAATVAVPNHDNGYVGGSSAATASMAGMAALVWSNDTNLTREQVLTRLIQSADNYPARSNDFGWGAVDMCAAVSAAPFIPCAVGTSNDVTMEITNIAFPSTFDAGTSNAEWVISFNGNPFFFGNVDTDGDSGDPANFIDIGECGSIPLLVELGTTSCTQSSLPITIDIHEDDGATNDCDCDCGFFGPDDDEGSFNSTVSFGATSFTIVTGEGNFVFTYELSCSSSMIPPAAGINIPQDTCLNAMIDVEFFATGGNSPYMAAYSVNGGSTQTLALTPNTGSIVHNTSTAGTTTYTLLSITDSDGCSQTLSQSESITIHPIPTITASAIDPTTCLGNDGSIVLTLTNVPDGTYDITHSGGVFTGVLVTSGSATIAGMSAGMYEDLSIIANTCESLELPDVILVDPLPTMIVLSTDAPRCPGTTTTVTASPAGMTNYSFFIDNNVNGVMDVGEGVQSGTSNTYNSTTFTDGDLLGVVMTDGNSCESIDVIVVPVLPTDYAFSGSGGLTGVELGSVDYETDGIIESTQRIDFSSIVDYDSAIEVHLLPGFETILGAQFEAFIDGCDNGGGGQL